MTPLWTYLLKYFSQNYTSWRFSKEMSIAKVFFMLSVFVSSFFLGALFSLLMLGGHLFYILEYIIWEDWSRHGGIRTDFSKHLLTAQWKQLKSFSWLHYGVTCVMHIVLFNNFLNDFFVALCSVSKNTHLKVIGSRNYILSIGLVMNGSLRLQDWRVILPNTWKACERLEDKLRLINSYKQRRPLPYLPHIFLLIVQSRLIIALKNKKKQGKIFIVTWARA